MSERLTQARINLRPFGAGIDSPDSFAVSIQRPIASSALATPGQFRHLGYEGLIFVAPVNDDFVLIHSFPPNLWGRRPRLRVALAARNFGRVKARRGSGEPPYRTTPAIGLLAAAYSFFGIRPAR
jgi:hypothetical protein